MSNPEVKLWIIDNDSDESNLWKQFEYDPVTRREMIGGPRGKLERLLVDIRKMFSVHLGWNPAQASV